MPDIRRPPNELTAAGVSFSLASNERRWRLRRGAAESRRFDGESRGLAIASPIEALNDALFGRRDLGRIFPLSSKQQEKVSGIPSRSLRDEFWIRALDDHSRIIIFLSGLMEQEWNPDIGDATDARCRDYIGI